MERKQIFSIKKLTVGATSVLIGTGIAFAATQTQAYAADVEKNAEISNNIEETSQQNEFDKKNLPKEETRLQRNNNEENSSLAQKVEEIPTLAQKVAEEINEKLTKDEEKTSLENTTNNKKIDETSSNLTNQKEGAVSLRSVSSAANGEKEVTDTVSDNKEVADDNIVWTKRNGNANLILDKDGLLTIEPVPNTDGKLNIMGMTGDTYDTILEDKKNDINKIKKVVFKPGTTASYNMRGAFSGFSNLEEIDLSNLNTKNVGFMNEMFSYGENIEKIILGDNFDTSNVKRMGGMFQGTKKLKSLNLGNKFNTKNVTMFPKMFSGSGLETLDLGDNFYINNAKSIAGMFSNMANLKTLTLGKNFLIPTKTVTKIDTADESLKTPFNNTNIKSINIPARTSTNEKNIFDLIGSNYKWLKDGEPIDNEKLYGENTLYSVGTYETYVIRYVADPTRDYGSENIVGKIKDGIQEIKVATRQTKDVMRTINFIDNVTGEKIKESVIQNVTLKNSATVDEKTGEKIDHWSTGEFDGVEVPTVDSYIITNDEKVTSEKITVDSKDETIDIKYQEVRPYKYVIQYLDGDDNNSIINEIKIEKQATKVKDDSGQIKWNIPYTKITNPFPREIDNKYELSRIIFGDEEMPKRLHYVYFTWGDFEIKGNVDEKYLNPSATLIYTHKKQDVTKSVTRTIRLLDAKDGKQLRVQRPNSNVVEDAVVKQVVTLKNTKDLVTNEFTGEWTGSSSFEKAFIDENHLGHFYHETEYYPSTPEIGGSEKTAHITTEYTRPNSVPEEKITVDTKDSIVDIYITRKDMHREGRKVDTIYKADPTKDFGYKDTTKGDMGLYHVYETYSRTSGQSEPTVVREVKEIAPKQDTIITVGTKAKVEKTILPIEVKYVADNTKDASYRSEKLGSATVITKTTNYTLNEQTGEVTLVTTTTTVEGTPTIITLGTKEEKVVRRTMKFIDEITKKEIEAPNVKNVQEVTLVRYDTVDENTGVLTKGNWNSVDFPEYIAPDLENYANPNIKVVPSKAPREGYSDETILINYQQKIEKTYEEKTITRTVNYVDALDGHTVAPSVNQEVTLYRSVDTNKVTKEVIKGTWGASKNYFDVVVSPDVAGYNPAEDLLYATPTEPFNDLVINIKYTHPEEKTITRTVEYIDVVTGEVISTKEEPITIQHRKVKAKDFDAADLDIELSKGRVKVVEEKTFTGTINYVTTNIVTDDSWIAVTDLNAVEAPQELGGYVRAITATNPNAGTIKIGQVLEDENIDVRVPYNQGEESVPETKIVTRKIKYIDAITGEEIAPSKVQIAILSRANIRNKVTGAITEGTWATAELSEVTSPKVENYNAPTVEKVASEKVTSDTNNIEEKVYYGKTTSTKEVIPYTTIYREDKTKEVGYRKVETLGGNGEKVVTTTYTPNADGVVSETKTESQTPAVAEVIVVGTKEKIENKEFDFTTRYVADESLEKGQRVIKEQGKLGSTSVTTTYTVDEKTGIVTKYEGYSLVVVPKDEVVAVGTKPTVTSERVEFSKEVRNNRNLPLNERHVVQEGQDGEVVTTITYTVDEKTGELAENSSTIITEAIPEITEVGTKVEEEKEGELPTLLTTRHVDKNGVDLFTPELGFTAAKEGVFKVGEKEYILDSKSETKEVRTYVYKEVFHNMKGDGATQGELPILLTTRHLIIGTNIEILPVEEGIKEHKNGVVQYKDKNYQFDATVIDEKNGITTHYYKLVEEKVPEDAPKEDELPILQTTRYLVKGTNTPIADVDLEYKDPKVTITFQGNEYKYDSTEEKDNVRIHYYILVEKEQPANKPLEQPADRALDKSTEKSADKSTEQPVKSLVQEKYAAQSVEKTNDLQTQTSKIQEVKQKQLPKTSATPAMSSLGYAALGLLALAARRRNKKVKSLKELEEEFLK